jgi:hypothetical protein
VPRVAHKDLDNPRTRSRLPPYRGLPTFPQALLLSALTYRVQPQGNPCLRNSGSAPGSWRWLFPTSSGQPSGEVEVASRSHFRAQNRELQRYRSGNPRFPKPKVAGSRPVVRFRRGSATLGICLQIQQGGMICRFMPRQRVPAASSAHRGILGSSLGRQRRCPGSMGSPGRSSSRRRRRV